MPRSSTPLENRVVAKYIKNIVKSFDNASCSYEQFGNIQFKSAKILTEYLIKNLKEYPKSILDLGCGTGYVTKLLIPSFPDSFFTLNDISSKMLSVSKKNIKGPIKIIEGNMETTNFKYHDLVVSNLSFQWLQNLGKTIEKFNNLSKTLAFTCLLDGTFAEWEYRFLKNGLPSPLFKYPKENDLKGIFHIEDFHMQFKNPLSFMHYLKNTGTFVGSNNYSVSNLKKIIITGPLHVTYKIAFCILQN